MTLKQRLLKAVYPLLMRIGKLSGWRNLRGQNAGMVQPPASFYDLQARMNNGSLMPMSALRGRKVLLVNTASDCGYTAQYAALQQLHERYAVKLAVIGFPSNDFRQQEQGNDAAIASFCQLNFGVTFPLAAKSAVTGAQKNDIYQWLSDPGKNGWNSREPGWNFAKYLVSETGVLLQYLDPGVAPDDPDLIKMIEA